MKIKYKIMQKAVLIGLQDSLKNVLNIFPQLNENKYFNQYIEECKNSEMVQSLIKCSESVLEEIEGICNKTKNKDPNSLYGKGWNEALEELIKKIKEVK